MKNVCWRQTAHSGIQGKVKSWLFCRYAQPTHDTKTHCPLPTQIQIYKSCQHSPQFTFLIWEITAFLMFMTYRVQWDKVCPCELNHFQGIYRDLAISVSCKEWWYIAAWYALQSLLLQQSSPNFCLAIQQRQIWDLPVCTQQHISLKQLDILTLTSQF